MVDEKDFIPGIYQHYKGGMYKALRLAYLEESMDPCVVYEDVNTGKSFLRPYNTPGESNWIAMVGDVPRFKFIGPLKDEPRKVEKPEKFCNKCGNSCRPPYKDWTDNYGLIDATVSGGYCSTYLNDCTVYKFTLCEKCLRHLFQTFEKPPQVGDYTPGIDGADWEVISYKDDMESLRWRLWRSTDGHIHKAMTGYCNGRRECHNVATLTQLFSGHDSGCRVCTDEKCQSHALNATLEPREPHKLIKLSNLKPTWEINGGVATCKLFNLVIELSEDDYKFGDFLYAVEEAQLEFLHVHYEDKTLETFLTSIGATWEPQDLDLGPDVRFELPSFIRTYKPED